jgi:lactate permease
MLVSTGHDPFQSVVLLLVFNTFATVWGAAGTPLWFGFGSLDLTTAETLDVSQKSAICLTIGAFLLMPWVLTILLPWRIVWDNIIFVFLSLAVSVGPSLGIAFISFEFPSLIGG